MLGGGALSGVGNGSRMRTKNNKRRFSDEQIKSLESIFDKEPKLEPHKKVEVARELGLQPRQVAIWFQNKRARWRSRQLESDFSLLRSNYDSLSSRFDSLNRDKHSLLFQLHKLKQLLGTSTQLEEGTAVINDRESQTDTKKQTVASAEEQKPTEEGSEYGASDDGCSHQTPSYFPMDEATPPGLLPMVEPTCSSLTSEEEWQSLHPQALFDRSTTSCDWWDLPFVDPI